jgi:hypothetical protein
VPQAHLFQALRGGEPHQGVGEQFPALVVVDLAGHAIHFTLRLYCHRDTLQSY